MRAVSMRYFNPMSDDVELYRRILAEFAVVGDSALVRLRDNDPEGYRRMNAYLARVPARARRKLATAFEDAMKTMQ